jgi:hypothetical protein
MWIGQIHPLFAKAAKLLSLQNGMKFPVTNVEPL